MKKKSVILFVFCLFVICFYAFPYNGLTIDPNNPGFFLYNDKPIFLIGHGNAHDVLTNTTVLNQFRGYGVNQFSTSIVPNSGYPNSQPYLNSNNPGVNNNWQGFDNRTMAEDNIDGFWAKLKQKAQTLLGDVNDPSDDAILVVFVFSSPARKGNKYWYKDEDDNWQNAWTDPLLTVSPTYDDTTWYDHLWNEDNGGPIANWYDGDRGYNRGVTRFYQLSNHDNFLFDYTSETDIESIYWGGNTAGDWVWKSQYRQEQLLAKTVMELSDYPNVALFLEWEIHTNWDSAQDWACHMVKYLKEVRDHYGSTMPIGIGSYEYSDSEDVLEEYEDYGNGNPHSDPIFRFIQGYNITYGDDDCSNNDPVNCPSPTYSIPVIYNGYHPEERCDFNNLQECACICDDYVLKNPPDPNDPYDCSCSDFSIEQSNIENIIGFMRLSTLRGMNTSHAFEGYWYNQIAAHVPSDCKYATYDEAAVRDEVTEYSSLLRSITSTIQSWDNEPGEVINEDNIPAYNDSLIFVMTPSSSNSYIVGETMAIDWVTWNISNNVAIDLIKSDETVTYSITSATLYNNSPFSYTIPTNALPGTYYVRVSQGSLEGSSNNFVIYPPSITVVSPNGGEALGLGRSHNITWDTAGLSPASTLKITLIKGDAETETVVGTIATGVDPSLGSYSWTVGEHAGGTAATGTEYRIKIKETGTAVVDKSDAFFSIVTPSITVTSPNGGEALGLGRSHNITWDTAGLSPASTLKITLIKGDAETETVVGTIATGVDPSLGSYSWTVGEHAGGTAATGTEYRIKIKETGTAVVDKSDDYFSIAQITVTSPNGGESWTAGNQQDITWTPGGLTDSDTVRITLLQNGVTVGTIATVDPASPSYSWTVGQYVGGTASPGTGYAIKLKVIGTSVTDTGDATFEITQ